MPPALSKRMPDGIRLFIAGRSLPILSRSIAARKQAREKNSVPLHSQHPPPSSLAVWHALFQTAARQRRGLSPRPEESFFGDGESTRGEGQFLQKTPLSLSAPLLHGSHNTHPPKTTAAPKGRRDEGMTRGRPRPHRGHGRPACYSISSVRIMWRAAAVASRRRTGIFTGASSSCGGSDLPRATISRRASM